jgi:hypothetical protein
MKMLSRAAIALLAFSLCGPIGAQTVMLPQVKNAAGQNVPAQGSVPIDATGVAYSAMNPLPVTVGSGAGDASAANQIAVQANPGSDAGKAVAVQGVAGGKPVATTVGGTLPPFATTPTFQIQPDATIGPSTGVSTINTDLLTNTVSGWYDAANFHSGSISIFTTAGISAGVITFEQTNDITNAAAGTLLLAMDMAAFNGNPVTSLTLAASTVRQFEFTVTARYVRFRISTGVTGGTVGATAVFSQLPFSTPRIYVVNQTAGNLNVTAVGAAAEDASVSSVLPVIGGGMVRTATAPTTLVANDGARLTMTNGAALVEKPYSIPQTDWRYTTTGSGTQSTISNTTTAVTLKAAGAASIKNYTTDCQLSHDTLGGTTDLVWRDGAGGTVQARLKLQTAAVENEQITFPIPLQGTAATLVEVATITPVTGGISINCGGYQAP